MRCDCLQAANACSGSLNVTNPKPRGCLVALSRITTCATPHMRLQAAEDIIFCMLTASSSSPNEEKWWRSVSAIWDEMNGRQVQESAHLLLLPSSVAQDRPPRKSLARIPAVGDLRRWIGSSDRWRQDQMESDTHLKLATGPSSPASGMGDPPKVSGISDDASSRLVVSSLLSPIAYKIA